MECWMLQEAQQLHLDDNAMQIIRQYKNTENEIYYTLQYQKQQFPVLPLNEEGLFLSKFELSLEKCEAQKHEIEWPELSTDEDDDGAFDDDADEQHDWPEGECGSKNNQEEEQEENNFPLDEVTTLNIFMQDRNSKEINIPNEPIALFDMWVSAMELQFKDVKEKRFD